MRILFMGSGELACPALSRLLDRPQDEIVAVISQPDRPKGRNRQVSPCPAKAYAESKGIPVLTPKRIGSPDAMSVVAALAPDLITVVAYGQYIKPDILAIPPLGAINVHPSLLPKYRGASPIQSALANGETITGVTILYVSEAMDAGDIILQKELPIDPNDNAISLASKCADLGGELLSQAIDALSQGKAPRIPQDESQATTVYKLKKEDGWIDWRQPANIIRNRIRGFTPWPGCFTRLQGKVLKVLHADLVYDSTGGFDLSDDGIDSSANSVQTSRRVESDVQGKGPMTEGTPGTVIRCLPEGPVVSTGNGALLLREVQPEGRKAMSGRAYLCGHSVKTGDQFELRDETLPDNPAK